VSGDSFPTVPVAGVELSRVQVAALLWSRPASRLFAASDDVLMDELSLAFTEAGGSGDVDVMVERLSAADSPVFTADGSGPGWSADARMAWARSYRLSVRHWYPGAVSRCLTQGEATALLYASSLLVQPLVAFSSQFLPGARVAPRRTAYVSACLTEGAARFDVARLPALGRAVTRRLSPSETDVDPQAHGAQDALLRASVPDAERLRFCFDIVANWCPFDAAPLFVTHADGRVALGPVTPRCPQTLPFEDAQTYLHMPAKHVGTAWVGLHTDPVNSTHTRT